MNPQTIIILITQLLPLIVKLVAEIQKIQGMSETDREALRKAVRETKEKVAALEWKPEQE